MLAPAGNFPGSAELKHARLLIKQASGEHGRDGDADASGKYRLMLKAAERLISQALGLDRVVCFGSGKEALAALCGQLKERFGCKHAVVAAYTCPDVAAAIVRGGLRLRVADVRPDTLDMLLLSPSGSPELVVLSNLYGLPDRVDIWNDSTRFVVDDACQAILSASGDYSVGARTQFGIVSFGRGKALCGIGGGGVLVRSENESDHQILDASSIRGIVREIQRARQIHSSPFGSLKGRLLLSLLPTLEKPKWYSKVTSIPGLGLGETNCDLSFSDALLTEPMLSAAVAQLCIAQEITRRNLANARRWHERLEDLDLLEPFMERGCKFDGSVIPTRYPIILNSPEQRTELLELMEESGLGASASYDRALTDFPELRPYIDEGDCAAAKEVARRIVTLPVHQYVSEDDIESGRAIVRDVLSES
ncbi:MAG: DegT/DnrJ/EryC1/StrS aminotransferase family protein [Bdellovibrionales bacterium]|nr:DegT/DnrJ/EryC1/StrS aminotransferase family protein [Bdellovibrionales bacterium]